MRCRGNATIGVQILLIQQEKKVNNIFKLCIFKSRMLTVYVCWKFTLKVVYLVLKNVCKNPEVAIMSLENCIWTFYVLLLLIWSRLFFFKALNSEGFLFSWEVRKWKLKEIKYDKEKKNTVKIVQILIDTALKLSLKNNLEGFIFASKGKLCQHIAVFCKHLEVLGNDLQDSMHIQSGFTCSVMSSMAQHSSSWGIPADKRGNF